MRTFTRSLLARLTIAIAVLVAVLAAPVGSSAFHEAASAGHVSMADLDGEGHSHEDHGHSHDVDDAADETTSASHDGDHHKHNPGDHSHEKLGIPPGLVTLTAVAIGKNLVALRDPKVQGLSSTFLRPPKLSDIA